MERPMERLVELEYAVCELRRKHRTVERKLRLWRGIAAGLGFAFLVSFPLRVGLAQGTGGDKLAIFLSHLLVENGGEDLVINGANLHIRNGSGATATPPSPAPPATPTAAARSR